MKAIGDNIIVEMEETPKQIGSILVPDTVKNRAQRGTVLSVGEDNPDGLKIGDTVLFNKLVKRREFEFEGKRCFKAKISNIDAKLDD